MGKGEGVSTKGWISFQVTRKLHVSSHCFQLDSRYLFLNSIIIMENIHN